jgi:hypothetical protein
LQLCFVCFPYSLFTFVLHPRKFISQLCLLLLLSTHLQYASSKLHFSTLFSLFAPCLSPFCILEASLLYFVSSFCSLSMFILHPRSFISLFRYLPLFHAYFHIVFSKLHFFAWFAPFSLCPLSCCIVEASFFYFVFLFVPYPPLFCILETSFLCFVNSLRSMLTSMLHSQSFIFLLGLLPFLHAHLHFTTLKLYFFVLFVPIFSCMSSFCILKALILCLVYSLCSLPNSVLHV